jgi:hypothetical protein
MILARWRPILVLAAAAATTAVLTGCAGLGSQRREAREARMNVFPDNYRSDLLGALHAYVIDPTNIRDAFLSDPAIRQIGTQNRYTACVRFNAKNGDGRYVGSRDVMAIFVNGRFDQFIDLTPQLGQSSQSSPSSTALQATEACAQAEYKPFPELQTMKR